MKRFAILVVFLLAGCAGRHSIRRWDYSNGAPQKPHERDCGVPIEFAFPDGHKETWVYKCWPESNVPQCLKGCRHD